MGTILTRTPDAVKYNKNCMDFKCLNDGTITGDYKYCDLSLECRQVDILPSGKTLPMEAHYVNVIDDTGEIVAQELMCTGHHDLRPLKERVEDDKVS